MKYPFEMIVNSGWDGKTYHKFYLADSPNKALLDAAEEYGNKSEYRLFIDPEHPWLVKNRKI